MIANPQSTFALTQNTLKKHASLALMVIAIFALLLMPDLAHAAGASSGGMPWESPLQKLIDSLTGPVAIGVSILAIFAAGVALAFGGEINPVCTSVDYSCISRCNYCIRCWCIDSINW